MRIIAKQSMVVVQNGDTMEYLPKGLYEVYVLPGTDTIQFRNKTTLVDVPNLSAPKSRILYPTKIHDINTLVNIINDLLNG